MAKREKTPVKDKKPKSVAVLASSTSSVHQHKSVFHINATDATAEPLPTSRLDREPPVIPSAFLEEAGGVISSRPLPFTAEQIWFSHSPMSTASETSAAWAASRLCSVRRLAMPRAPRPTKKARSRRCSSPSPPPPRFPEPVPPPEPDPPWPWARARGARDPPRPPCLVALVARFTTPSPRPCVVRRLGTVTRVLAQDLDPAHLNPERRP
mmetsp:Transcript_5187/g.18179  ORF Transcript_5187/g.18179 Transcript_5187/m.18179 type:complete len:210 (+) Transcript_5187:2299-2928(+)